MIKIVHQNIQGVGRKSLEIELFLNEFDVEILCLTELWHKDIEILLRFDSYKLGSYFTRKNAMGGGSCILIKKNINSRERSDIVNESVERHVEFSCLELNILIIISVYRPPSGNFNVFVTAMEEVLRKTFSGKKPVIVCGDFNVDILKDSTETHNLINLFNSFNIQNVFLEPT